MILGQWQIRCSDFGQPRDGAGIAELDGAIYVLGGWGSYLPAPANTTNDFRVSYDRGATWKALPTPPFEPRHTFGFKAAWGKLWVLGGDMNSGHYQRDMWSWAPWQGWNKEMDVIPCLSQGRVLFHDFHFNDRLWIVGGQTLDEFITNGPKANRAEGPYYDDVHCFHPSTGWQEVSTGNPWAPAGMVQGNAVLDGNMYLVCGGAYNTEGRVRVYKDTVYRSSDGVSWPLVAEGVIPKRQYTSVVALGDELAIIGGNDTNGNRADAWAMKADGAARNLRGVTFDAQHAMSCVAHRGEILALGGWLTDRSVRALS